MTTTSPRPFPDRTISPMAWAARPITTPVERGFEREVRKRLEYWAKLRKERG